MLRKTGKLMSSFIMTAVLVTSLHFSIPATAQAQELDRIAAVKASSTLKASISKASMEKGDTKKVTLTYGGSSISASNATWKTSKSSVATVKNGTITAKGEGKATITAKYSGKTVTIDVTVKEEKGELVAAETKVTMVKGDTATITLKYDGSKLTGSKADWSTSKSSVVTVSNGVLTAKGKGTATITAKYKGETVKIQVTVNEDTKEKLVAAETKVTMVKGDTATINLKYDGSKLTGSKADWSTSKSSVVTVSNGVLTAKGKGTATITAKYKGETVKIQVTVNEDTKEKLVAAETKVTMVKGDTATINLKYDGSKLTGSKADWSTSKSSVVTVSNGVLTAKGKGTATITAKYKGETVKIQVTVNEDTKNKLEAAETKVTMVKGDTATINLKYDGSKLTGSKADWSTSKSSVVTVSNGVLTAKGKGTATITAEYKGETVKIQVTVNEESKDKLVATKTKISMDKGDTETISLKYDGSKLTGSKADWSTSKSSVATVKNGVVTAKGAGTATITAEYKNEKVKIEITVSDSKDKLSVDDDSISIKVGKTETIKVTYNGKKVSGSDVKWSTSKSSVAKVKDGVVTGKKKGKAVITAKYKGEEVEIRVTVK
ncbi:Ig-like domain-containing protein [Brevibacillus panacihumi]|uniref:Ig-like domain-containing protein n=1 Tax=Brevibacillus panacihumi TaxID=497735 RepID=UPI003D05F75B